MLSSGRLGQLSDNAYSTSRTHKQRRCDTSINKWQSGGQCVSRHRAIKQFCRVLSGNQEVDRRQYVPWIEYAK